MCTPTYLYLIYMKGGRERGRERRKEDRREGSMEGRMRGGRGGGKHFAVHIHYLHFAVTIQAISEKNMAFILTF